MTAPAATPPADDTIEQITADRSAHYEPFGWHHWPEHPWLSYQFRRGLGETQEGGGGVSEGLQAASRMIPREPATWKAGTPNGCASPIATGRAASPRKRPATSARR